MTTIGSTMISAATHSSVLANAPTPKRLGLNEQPKVNDRVHEMLAAVREIARKEKGGGATWSDENAAYIAEKFGMSTSQAAGNLVAAAMRELEGQSGYGSSSPPPMAPSFAGTDKKTFAQSKIGDLLNGIAVYNFTLKNNTPERIKENREVAWNKSFEAQMKRNGGDAKDAIATADDFMKNVLEVAGNFRGGDASVLNNAIAAISSAFNIDYRQFVLEGTDGLLSLNHAFLKDTEFGKLVNLEKNWGYLLDKAA